MPETRANDGNLLIPCRMI